MSARASRAVAERSTLRSLASIVLGFEVVVVGLAGLVLFGLQELGDLDPRWALVGGGAVVVMMIVGLTVMRTQPSVGVVLGSLAQVILTVAGVWHMPLYFVGAGFAALWVYALIKGAQIDRDRAAWMLEHADEIAAYEAQRAVDAPEAEASWPNAAPTRAESQTQTTPQPDSR